MDKDISNLQQMLDRIGISTKDTERPSLGRIVETIGGRSFGPLLLMAGIVMTSPLGGIPGMPTTMGIMVLLIAVQLLFGRQNFWLPRWLLKRSVAKNRICKMVNWLRPSARFIDRCIRPRLSVFIQGASIHVIASVCIVIAVGLPMMELIPFSAHAAGIALTAFGLSLIARDGLVALLAFLATAITLGSVVYQFF